jgi:hypothetical protein
MDSKCTFEGCERDERAKKLCLGHYTQQRRGKTLKPLGKSTKKAERDANGKVCKGCKTHKPYEDFYKQVGGAGGVMSRCKECHRGTTLGGYYRRKNELQELGTTQRDSV